MIRWSLQSIRSAMGTITSSRTTMLPAAKLLLSKNGRHSMTSMHCAKSPDLRPIDKLLGRYQAWLVQEHSKERTWIRDNNPWHLESDSHQKVQSMLSRIQNCLNTRGRYTRYYVVIRSIVMQCCYKLYCLYFCCLCMLFREMLPTISILSQCHKPQIFLGKLIIAVVKILIMSDI